MWGPVGRRGGDRSDREGRAACKWLLNLYILRYDQEQFGVVLSGNRRIATRIILRPELERPGRAEWGRDELFLILDTEELDYWVHTFRRWYQGVWDVYTAPHLDVDFDPDQTNLPRGLDLVLGPGADWEPGRGSTGPKHRRGKHE